MVSGPEQMVGSVGPVLVWNDGYGKVRVHGEVWQARAATPLRTGQQVRVKRIEGLTLDVEPEDVETH